MFAATLVAVGAALAARPIQAAGIASDETRIVFTEGKVEFSQAGAVDWQPASTNNLLRAAYRLRTGERSRAMLLWADRAVATIGESTIIEILPSDESKAQFGVHLWRGLLSFFHRDEPGRFRVTTRSAMAGIKGTEFVVAVDPITEVATLSVIDGNVSFSNPQGALSLTNLEQAVAEPGQPPRRTPGFTVNQVLQWCFYYPGVLDPGELPLSDAERQTLATSLAAYRDGDLLAALENYPANRQPESAAERVYFAALLLSVGLAQQAEATLALLEPAATDIRTVRLAGALRLLIDVVKNPVKTRASASQELRGGSDGVEHLPTETTTATEALALSYHEQSRAIRDVSLRKALAAARRATELSPTFSFAWARVAELEFSFGRTREALDALRKVLGNPEDRPTQAAIPLRKTADVVSLTPGDKAGVRADVHSITTNKSRHALSPRNAQALALQGFLLAAQNKTRAALDSFDQALAIDPALGNAWLGRGLCKIRLTPDFFSLSPGVRAGQSPALSGLDDLLIAAAVEPQRSVLRSYLGKAWSLGHRNPVLARKELDLAMQLDPADPTPWLYRALLNEQENRINEGIRDLEKSQELNDNRRLYRSRLLLDQDRSVGSANLANLYRDAGMTDWGVQEAGRAVAADYANYSAHLFLANSYDDLRDPNRVNLRYETPAESEYLIANLLAPLAAGLRAQSISQQEYSKLFERDRVGVASSTEYLSRGAWAEHGGQFGTFQNSSYLFEGLYRWDPGQRPNNDFEETELRLHLKQQLTPKDSLYFRAINYKADGGDVLQYYDPVQASAGLRTKESQSPIIHAGYHHEWRPGIHTLLLAGFVGSEYELTNRLHPTYFLLSPQAEPPTDFELMWSSLHYQAEVTFFSAELQQIWTQGDHNTVVGGRVQSGEIRTTSLQADHVVLGEINGYFEPGVPLARQQFKSNFERLSAYVYHDWQIHPAVQLVAGLAYDHMFFPENFLTPPLTGGEEEADQISPKAGLIWKPSQATSMRLAYARALAGVTSEQSYAIEPTQVAGFNQSFRTIEPKSIGGSGVGAKLEMFDAAVEHQLGSSTYLGLSGQLLNAVDHRKIGVFRYDELNFYAQPSSTRNVRDYREESLALSLHQLVEEDWSLGLSYRLTHSTLENDFTEVPSSAFTLGVRPHAETAATLHQLLFHIGYQAPAGFFWLGQALWTKQENGGDFDPALAGEDFWQFNLFAGYRFPSRRTELRLGLLNLTDQDYRLNPLSLYNDLPRSRTLSVRIQFHF